MGGYSQIWSVQGPIKAGELGLTLYHEHPVYLAPDVEVLKGPPLTKEFAIPEAKKYRDAGGRTLISLTCEPLGRDVTALKEIAASSGVNILASTGYYVQDASPAIKDSASLAEIMIKEIEVGIDGTDVRAAVVGEFGTMPQAPGEWEYLMFAAAAKAHERTRVPLATHTYCGRYSAWQADYLINHGVDPRCIAIGHMDTSLDRATGGVDLAAVLALADRGVFVGFDTIGHDAYSKWAGRVHHSDHQRAWAIAKLCERGYEDHVLLATDNDSPETFQAHGGRGWAYVLSSVLPLLEGYGVTPAQIEKFVRVNPARWLTGS